MAQSSNILASFAPLGTALDEGLANSEIRLLLKKHGDSLKSTFFLELRGSFR